MEAETLRTWFYLAGIKAVRLIGMCICTLAGKTMRLGQKLSCDGAAQVPLRFTDKSSVLSVVKQTTRKMLTCPDERRLGNDLKAK